MSEHKDDYGTWNISAGKFFGDEERDKGLQTSNDTRFYAISAKFSKSFSNKGRSVVIQFTVKHEQNIDCGGGYVKVCLFELRLELRLKVYFFRLWVLILTKKIFTVKPLTM